MAQFTVVIGVFAALSGAGLGIGIELLRDVNFMQALVCRQYFFIALVFFTASLLFCTLCVMSRLLDFRLTAQKVKDGFNSKRFGLNKDAFSSLSWGLFWLAFISLFGGGSFLIFSIAETYWQPLLGN